MATTFRSHNEDNNKRNGVILMLSENIRSIRKAKGLSQEEFAIKLYVVRQTVSKWERGLSVPDSEMLLHIAEILETPVSVLLGETQTETEIPLNDWNVISEKLEVINLQLAREKERKRKFYTGCLSQYVLSLCSSLPFCLRKIAPIWNGISMIQKRQSLAPSFMRLNGSLCDWLRLLFLERL